MANQATIATGIHDPRTNGRVGAAHTFGKSIALIADQRSRCPPISTVRDWDGTNPRTKRHLVRLLQASPGSFPSVALAWLPHWDVPLGTVKTGWLTSIFPSVDAILATCFFRYWHWMFIFTAWSTIITIIHQLKIANLSIQSTLLTVLGIVVGCTYFSFHLPGNNFDESHSPQS